jgi:hypothetical protein
MARKERDGEGEGVVDPGDGKERWRASRKYTENERKKKKKKKKKKTTQKKMKDEK